jgi:C-terminal processing protease CtpA/Prc
MLMKTRIYKHLLTTIFLLSFFTLKAQLPSRISPADKVFALSRFWQEVNYNFVYLDKVDRKMWDSAYRAMITSVQATANDYEYFRELMRFCALLKDGHTNIYYPPYVQEKLFTSMFGDYRLMLSNIGGKAIIERTNPAGKEMLPVGGEIMEVNGLPVKTYIAKYVAPYISSSTDYVLEDLCINGLLQGLEGQTYDLKIKTPEGKITTTSLTHKRSTDLTVYPPFPETGLLDVKWYGDIAYVALNSFGNRKIDTLFIEKLPELYKAKGVVIDLRNNGGGSTDIGTNILEYFTNDTILQHSKYQTRQHLASFKAWGIELLPKDTIGREWNTKSYLYNHDLVTYSFDYSPNKVKAGLKTLVVPTAILIGHKTASAAEDFLISADNQKHMIRIGERSFGSTGQPYQFDLPGGGSARVCTKKDTYPDGREFVGYGVKPDIEVAPTVKDFIDNKDPVLEKALDYLKQKVK